MQTSYLFWVCCMEEYKRMPTRIMAPTTVMTRICNLRLAILSLGDLKLRRELCACPDELQFSRRPPPVSFAARRFSCAAPGLPDDCRLRCRNFCCGRLF